MRLIDANKLVMHLADFALSMSGKPGYSEIQQCMEAVEEQPTADPVKHGRWKKAYADHVAFGERPLYRYCSECCEVTVFPYKFCPHCGAYMVDEEE